MRSCRTGHSLLAHPITPRTRFSEKRNASPIWITRAYQATRATGTMGADIHFSRVKTESKNEIRNK